MAIWIDIDAKSGVPIFKQIVDQVKRAVATGMLRPDEQLPTVRELAEEHSINPNTIAKAYDKLKDAGLVYSRPGVGGGIFVAKGAQANARGVELERFQEDLRRTVKDGYNLGLAQSELNQRFQREVSEWYTTHPLPEPASIPISPNGAVHRQYTSQE